LHLAPRFKGRNSIKGKLFHRQTVICAARASPQRFSGDITEVEMEPFRGRWPKHRINSKDKK
ncbi:hypothetical protein IscW_ISCW021487, partial [Ixodes scapularis]